MLIISNMFSVNSKSLKERNSTLIQVGRHLNSPLFEIITHRPKTEWNRALL